MKIIVTGGCGFIGGHLVDELVSKHDVLVIDDLSADNDSFHYNNSAKYHRIDICDPLIEPLFEGVDYVFHLAAESRIQPSIYNPLRAAQVNVLGTTNILTSCVKNNVKRIIYSSTSAVYGLTTELPTGEDVLIDCLNPYAATKFGGEELVRCFTKLYGLDSCIFRYFNVYGENSPVTGQYSPVIGIFLKQKKNGQSLTVVGDGSSKRDFIHVNDVVQANILTMEHEDNLNGSVFNIGYGTNISILSIAKFISSDIQFIDSRVGEAKSTLADIRKAISILDWHPRTNLLGWLRAQLD